MVSFENTNISYGSEKVIVDFSATITKGEKIVLQGPSGSGKSTLMNAICGFVQPVSGTVTVDGLLVEAQNILSIRKIISWLPQEIDFNLTSCRELLYYPFQFSFNKPITPKGDEVNALLEKLLLPPAILEKNILEISGGQKQRIGIASVLLLKRPLILLDEPTSALDKAATDALIDIIKNNKNLTVVSSSHDPYWTEAMDRIIQIKQGNNA